MIEMLGIAAVTNVKGIKNRYIFAERVVECIRGFVDWPNRWKVTCRAIIYLFKVNNGNTLKYVQSCSSVSIVHSETGKDLLGKNSFTKIKLHRKFSSRSFTKIWSAVSRCNTFEKVLLECLHAQTASYWAWQIFLYSFV